MERRSKRGCPAMRATSSIAADIVGNVLPIGCAYDILTQLWNPWDAVKPDRVETETTFDKTLGWAAAIGGCVDDLIPPAKLLMMGFQIGQAIYEGYQKNEECHRNFDPLYKNRLGVKTVSSFDPNEMIGPSGFGDQNWIQISKRIPYTILFENKSSATAPAHEVYITDSLDLNNYDINEFGFNSFGFGDTIITLGGNNLKKFTVDVDMRPKIESIARVTGNLDTLTGVINWHFKSLTPSTMSIEEDPFIGFLPPNNSEHAGEGFVSYMTGIKENLTTNSELKNKATIVFDANKPIVTNEYTNTLDLDKPQSSVKQLEATTGNYLTLSWGGDDLGSGIQEYSVFYLENDTLLQPVIVNTTETSTLFVANVGSKYKFYSLATDNVSLKEDDPSVYDASTHVTVDAKEFSDRKDEIQIFPNPVKGEMNVILPGASEGVYLVEMIDMKGKSCFSDIYECRSISGGIKIKTEQFSSGLYLVRIVHGNSYETRKIRISNKPEK